MWLLLACVETGDEKAPSTNPEPAPVLRFRLEGRSGELDPAGLELGLAPYDPAASSPVGAEAYRFGGADAVAGLQPETPDAALLLEIDPVQAPGMRVTTFVPGLFDGDALLGVGEVWPTYVSGSIGQVYADLGLSAGWNAVYIDDDHRMSVEDPLEIVVEDGLAVVETLEVSGEATSGAAERLAAVAEAGPVADIPTVSAWSMVATGAPEGVEALDRYAGDGVVAPLIGYEDLDGDGQAGPDDLVMHAICHLDGDLPAPTGLLWLEPVVTLADGLERQRRGLQNGWNLVVQVPEPEAVAPTGLYADPSCTAYWEQ